MSSSHHPENVISWNRTQFDSGLVIPFFPGFFSRIRDFSKILKAQKVLKRPKLASIEIFSRFSGIFKMSNIYVGNLMAPLILVILSEILAFVIGFLLVCPQGITDFAENGTWYQIFDLNIRHFKKSRKSEIFCKL